MVTKGEILEKLKTLTDPEIGVDVVNLGLVYEVDVDDSGNVRIKMTLTTIGCPYAYWLVGKVKEAVESIPEVKDVDIYLTFDPPWSPDMMSEEAKKKLGYSGQNAESKGSKSED